MAAWFHLSAICITLVVLCTASSTIAQTGLMHTSRVPWYCFGATHLLLAQLVQQGLDHAQRLVVGGAAPPYLRQPQLPEELVHCHEHHRALDLLHSVTLTTTYE